MGLLDKIFKSKSDDALENYPQLKPVDRRAARRETSEGKVIFKEFRLHGKTYYFEYTNKQGEKTERCIMLVTVTTYSTGVVKISGYDNDRKEMRRFNLDYAENVQDEDLSPIKEAKSHFLSLVSDLEADRTGEIEI